MKKTDLRDASPRPAIHALPGLPARLLTLLLVLLVAWTNALAGATQMADVVGDRSRNEALSFEGLRAINRNEILSALALHLDYQLAAHPDAPLDVYLNTLKKLILDGYQHSGFPLATVSAHLDAANTQHIVVRVFEGPRFRCGEVKVVGSKRFTSDLFKSQLIPAVIDPCQCNDQATNYYQANPPASHSVSTGQAKDSGITWLAGEPAPFDETARQIFATRAENAIQDMGFYQTELNVRVASDPARSLADLVIEIANGGVRGTINEIEVAGCNQNTREQVLNYLHLKKGIAVPSHLLADLRETLRNSARFRRYDCTLTSLAKPEQLKLKLDLTELDEAPALCQDFNAQSKIALKFCNWVQQIGQQQDDLDATIAGRLGDRQWDGKLVCSASGLVISLRNPDASQPPLLDWTAVIGERQTTLYSGVQKRKLVSGNLLAQASIYASTKPQGGSNNFTVGMGFTEPKAPFPPILFNFDLEPAMFVHFLGSNSVCSIDKGVATFSNRPAEETNGWNLRLDPDTGRLLGFEFHKPDFEFKLSSGRGTFARTVQEIATRTQSYHEDLLTGATPDLLPSVISIFAPDLIRWGSLLHTNPSPAETVLLRWLADQADLKRIVSPLTRLIEANADSSFVIPLAKGDSDQAELAAKIKGKMATEPIQQIRNFLFQDCDKISPHGSWPWTLLHETAMTLSGQTQYTGAEVQRIVDSRDTGPLGYLVAMPMLSTLNPAAVRPYFARSLAAVSPDGFRKDWRVLLDDQTVLGALLANTLGELRSLPDTESARLVAGIKPDDAAFLLQSIQLVKANPDKPIAEVLWPAVEAHWDKVFKPRLVNYFMADFQSIETALRRKGDVSGAEAVHRELLALKKNAALKTQSDADNEPATGGNQH